MIDIDAWISRFLEALQENFGQRVWFTGLQGSYSRGEATESSDIDMVVILDQLSTEDIYTYSNMLGGLSHRELICGFLSGKQELLNWDAADLFQFYYDTRPLQGSLDELLEKIDRDTVDRAIRAGLCSIYHTCVHNMLYEKEEEILRSLYKAASFVIQASCFQRTGVYPARQQELLCAADRTEQGIVQNFWSLKNGGEMDFGAMSRDLFAWVQKRIQT